MWDRIANWWDRAVAWAQDFVATVVAVLTLLAITIVILIGGRCDCES